MLLLRPSINVVSPGKEFGLDVNDLRCNVVVLLFAECNSGGKEPDDLEVLVLLENGLGRCADLMRRDILELMLYTHHSTVFELVSIHHRLLSR